MGFWSDGTDAALRYLKALRAHLSGDSDTLIIEYTQGREQFDNALLHSFPYVADTQYARAGTRAVWPVVEALGEYLRPIVGDATGTVDVVTEVTLQGLATSGNPVNIVDGDPATYTHFSGSNPTTNVNVGDSFTITYEPYQRADSVTLIQSVPDGRPQDVLRNALVEYTIDGSTWVELGHVNGDAEQTIKLPKTLDLKGLRFTNQEYYNGYWQVNEVLTAQAQAKPFSPFASIDPASGDLAAIIDGDTSTGVSFDVPGTGMNAGISFVKTTEIGVVEIAQGTNAHAGKVEALVGGAWTEIGSFAAESSQTVELEKNTPVNGLRLVVSDAGTWDLNEVAARRLPSKVTPVMDAGMGAYESYTLDKIADGNVSTYAHLKNIESNNIRANDWVGLTFEPAARIGKITFVQDVDGGDVIIKGKVEYQAEDGSWHKVGDVTSAKTQTFEFANVTAQAIRVTNLENTAKWWKVFELSAEEGYESPAGAIKTDIEGLALSGVADSTSARITGGKVTIPAGSYVAIDLATIQAQITVDPSTVSAITDSGLSIVSSVNGLSWDVAESGAVASARFVGVRNLSGQSIEFDFAANPFVVSYPGIPGDFTCDSDPIDVDHGTSALTDGRVTTYWRPANASGRLTYHVSDPLAGGLPRDVVRFVSWGVPSGARVSATVYNRPDYSSTTELDLGVLDKPVLDFSFSSAASTARAQGSARFYGVKEVHVTWNEGQVPSIAELSMADATYEPGPLPDLFMVRFMVDGTVFAEFEVEDGSLVSAPAQDPIKEGYVFDGWYLGEQRFDFSTPVSGNLDLTARFVKQGPVDPQPPIEPEKPKPENPGSPGGLPSTGDAATMLFVGVTALGVMLCAFGAKRRATRR